MIILNNKTPSNSKYQLISDQKTDSNETMAKNSLTKSTKRINPGVVCMMETSASIRFTVGWGWCCPGRQRGSINTSAESLGLASCPCLPAHCPAQTPNPAVPLRPSECGKTEEAEPEPEPEPDAVPAHSDETRRTQTLRSSFQTGKSAEKF